MSDGARALLAVSAALAARDEDVLEEALERAVEEAEGARVEEVLLQSYLFLGYPTALNAFGAWRRVSGRPAGPSSEDDHLWARRGHRVCQEVYGGQYAGLRENVRALHPEMERWMVEEGYGKVLGRPGLELSTRELCIVALLAVLDTPRQLHSHLRGALNVGASRHDVEEALAAAAAVSPPEAQARARVTWKSVWSRWIEKGER